MSNRKNGTIYVGVTNNITRRVYEHKFCELGGFTQKYGLHKLVYYEKYDDIYIAIEREKQLKNWKRAWKIELIVAINPQWVDLGLTLMDCGSGPAMTG
ncbi:MAG: GIY-YIG nuclease family protein [Clostridiales Family XIII bacterium]|nr:GIY-YIG nuclease family protein [Clostridiales Family XIII bacterium]